MYMLGLKGLIFGNLARIKPGFQRYSPLGRHFLLAPIKPEFWPYFLRKCALASSG